MKKKRRHKKKRKGLLILLLVLLVIGGCGFAVVNHYVNKIGRVGDTYMVMPGDEDFETDENPGYDVWDPNDIDWLANGLENAEPLNDEELLNILLVGQDKSPGEGRQRSGAMILCSINPSAKKVSLISFLRDLYVQIPGYTDNRLNAAYAFGGFPLLKDTLYTNFGVTVDGCFEVDFTGFRALIDQIGGIDITLTEGEAELVGAGATEGLNHLNGTQALTYARIRKIGTDFARTNRQRTVLLAAYEKVKDKSVTEILRLLDAALPYLATDMTNVDIYATATKLLPLVSSVEINSYHVPIEGTYLNLYIRKMAVLYPHIPAIRSLLKHEYLPF